MSIVAESENWFRLVEPDMNGGQISRERIDAFADSDSESLMISGLRQETLVYLIRKFGGRIHRLSLFKCPRLEDLTPLEGLPNVRVIEIFWNQKANRLWDFQNNPLLERFDFRAMNRVRNLEDLQSFVNLRQLGFGNSFVGNSSIESLEPVAALAGSLRSLEFSPSKIDNNRAAPLAKLHNLKHLSFSSRLFSTEKLAWIKAKLPDEIQSDILSPYQEFDDDHLRPKTVMINGKRKPFLDPVADATRIAKYVNHFEREFTKYRANPSLPEPE